MIRELQREILIANFVLEDAINYQNQELRQKAIKHLKAAITMKGEGNSMNDLTAIESIIKASSLIRSAVELADMKDGIINNDLVEAALLFIENAIKDLERGAD